MNPSNLNIFRTITNWIETESVIWLITVIKTWGSSPRPAGSMMICSGSGQMLGSVSGGCVEDELYSELTNPANNFNQTNFNQSTPFIRVYGKTSAEQERFQLPCGGQLSLLIEPIQASDLPHFLNLVELLAQQQCIIRSISTSNHEKQIEMVDADHNVINANPIMIEKHNNENDLTIYHHVGPRCRLLIIGAGPVSYYVARYARDLEIEVTVCEPRSHYAEQWSLPDITLSSKMPDDLVRSHYSDRFSAIVALAHDPRLDDMGLMEALNTDAFYIGAMGSTRTSEQRRSRLRQLSLTDKQIAKLHAPIGLDISSHTPAEIAIAITADIIKTLNYQDSELSKA